MFKNERIFCAPALFYVTSVAFLARAIMVSFSSQFKNNEGIEPRNVNR